MNLFMHYAFDAWMQRHFPQCLFARYADDAVVHCRSEAQAQEVMHAIASRLAECGLQMHPEKSHDTWLVELLWGFLSDGHARTRSVSRPQARALGSAQVQDTATAHTAQ
ncbi:hypothetical protein OKW43_007725 [Paraburkholderia sp. WC7.3g]